MNLPKNKIKTQATILQNRSNQVKTQYEAMSVMHSGGGSSKILRVTYGEQFGVKGVTPSKGHRFWPICLLPVESVATFFLSLSLFLL